MSWVVVAPGAGCPFHDNPTMSSRWSALLVWGMAAAAAVFWALRLLAPSSPVPATAQLADSGVVLVGDLTRLLGAPPVRAPDPAAVVPDAASRFKLTGVVATRSPPEPAGLAAPGLALISVDGKPPQAYRVGEALDPRLVLQSVGLRSARIGVSGGDAGFVVSLPPPVPPSTGVPSGGVGGMVPPVLGMPPQMFSPPLPTNQVVPPLNSGQPGMPPSGVPNTQNRGQIQ